MLHKIDFLILIYNSTKEKIDFLNKIVTSQLNTQELEYKINYYFINNIDNTWPISILSRIVDISLYSNINDLFENSKIIYTFDDDIDTIKQLFPELKNKLLMLNSNEDFTNQIKTNNLRIQDKNKLKFLQLINLYTNYYEYFYQKYPQAKFLNYDQHYNLLINDGFAATHYFALEMHNFGYDSKMIIGNDNILLNKLAQLINIPFTNNRLEFLAKFVDFEKPDILFISDAIEFDYKFTKLLNHKPRLIIAWRSQSVSEEMDWRDYDIVVSNMYKIKDSALQKGVKYFEEFYPAFPNYILNNLEPNNYELDLSFAGQITLDHIKRIKYLEILANIIDPNIIKFAVFTPNQNSLPLEFKLNNFLQKEKFGLDYYNTFKKTKINLNIHLDIADNIGNMRLFEITGTGSFLLTDYHPNIENFFKIGEEIDVFNSPEELVQKIHYYLTNEQLRERIALKGQEKCLNQFSLYNAAYKLHQIIQKYWNINTKIETKNKILSPITKKDNIKLIAKIPKSILIEGYKAYQTDVEYIFKHIDTIDYYECLDTRYKFFYPFNITGDDNFYQSLEKFPWYYMDDKWEFDNALKYIKDSDYVLEIGSGRGAFLEKLKNKYIKHLGIELNTHGIELSKQKGVNAQQINLYDLATTHPNTFDFVCAFQVLEHIPDVYEFFNASLKVLKPGGLLYFSVPNDDAFIGVDINNWLNYPPHHMGRWNEKAFFNLTKYFSINFVKSEFEPLANYHINYFLNLLENYTDPQLKLSQVFKLNIFSNNLPNNSIRGLTIAAIFQKKQEI